jgi:uncharacterized protein YbjT (DUF2867 family)
MKVIIFGATGMVGHAVLRECLVDDSVESVLAITRTTLGQSHPKLRELVHGDFDNYGPIESELWGYDACFFCLGISSVGMTEEAYRRITYDFAVAAGQALVQRNPGMTFIFVSGASTDSTEKGKVMWARVKGQAENALMKMPFKAVFCFRPGFIKPMHGIVTKSRWLRAGYAVLVPLYPLLKTLFPRHVTTSDRVGRAMINVVEKGWPNRILENEDINAAGSPT